MRFALAALLLIPISCSNSPTEPGSGAGAVTLRYGETAVIGGNRVTFSDIHDSRCAKDVACVWAGDAAVQLNSGTEVLVLHTNATAGATSGKLAGVNINLEDVKPERITSDPITKSDYRISLSVSSK